MKQWELIDVSEPIAEPFSGNEDYPRLGIESAGQLQEVLAQLSNEPPRIVILRHPSGESFLIGIGGPFCAIQHSAEPHAHTCRTALTNEVISESPVEYQFEGSQSGFWPKNLIPLQDALGIIVCFFRSRQLSDLVKWS